MMKQLSHWIRILIRFASVHTTNKQILLILSFVVGILSAIAALCLKSLISFIHHFISTQIDVEGANILYLLLPSIGILLAGLFVRYIVKDDISHGVTKILYSISSQKGVLKLHNIWSSLVGSGITIGFGGSVGAESPIVMTGAAIGSNMGRLFKLEHKMMVLLIGCGAAGAVSGIFKAPIAGLFFTLEVLMLDLTMTSLLPLMISSVTAASLTYIISGSQAMFKFSMDQPFDLERIPYVVVLGICCGLLSLYFTKANTWFESVFKRLGSYLPKFILGSVSLSFLIFIFPPLFGEGYTTINELLAGSSTKLLEGTLFYDYRGSFVVLFLFTLFTMLAKAFATSATNGGGGVGGLFAPSLFLGCLMGFILAHTSNHWHLPTYLPETNFALLGMAGVMSGMMHAPLMGMFLIAELTGGFDLFLPLMIVSTVSYLTIRAFLPHSIYAIRLAQKGELLSRNKDKAVLTLMRLESVIEKDFLTVSPDLYLGDIIHTVSASKRNIFPVVDLRGNLLGEVRLDDIRTIMFRPELYQYFQVKQLMVSVPVTLNLDDPMEVVMAKLDQAKAWNLPVIHEGKYMGIVSKSKIFNAYRTQLVNVSSD